MIVGIKFTDGTILQDATLDHQWAPNAYGRLSATHKFTLPNRELTAKATGVIIAGHWVWVPCAEVRFWKTNGKGRWPWSPPRVGMPSTLTVTMTLPKFTDCTLESVHG